MTWWWGVALLSCGVESLKRKIEPGDATVGRSNKNHSLGAWRGRDRKKGFVEGKDAQ